MTVIAYFGPAGTFTEMALDRLLDVGIGDTTTPPVGPAVERIALTTPGAVIEAVRSGTADFGCVPTESSLEGSVPATMDAFVPGGGPDGSRVQVFGETILDIAFTIAARTELAPAEVTTIAAYPVASAQVRNTVAERFPNARFETAASNAAAAYDVADGRADAAVTTPLAAGLAGLVSLADDVCDARDASTRFLFVGRPAPCPPRTGADRTAVILELPNTPGSLMSAMNEFASRGVDLTRIESRPRRDLDHGRTFAGQYRFFLDAVGHIEDDAVGEALRALYRRCERVVFLGSWAADRGTGAPPPDTTDSAEWYERLRRGEDG